MPGCKQPLPGASGQVDAVCPRVQLGLSQDWPQIPEAGAPSVHARGEGRRNAAEWAGCKSSEAEAGEGERAQEKVGTGQRQASSQGPGPHLELLVLLQPALGLRGAARGAPGLHLCPQPPGPGRPVPQRGLQVLRLLRGLQCLPPAHSVHQLALGPPSPCPPHTHQHSPSPNPLSPRRDRGLGIHRGTIPMVI